MTEHILKIHPKPFADLASGAKTGEIRDCSDRDFKVGDAARLVMVDETGNPAGKELARRITHIQHGYGLPDNICVLSYGQPADHCEDALHMVDHVGALNEMVAAPDSKCPDCNGRGQHCMAGCSAHPDNWYDCDACKGTGRVQP